MWETSLHNPSFAAYANLCGGKGFKVTSVNQTLGLSGTFVDTFA